LSLLSSDLFSKIKAGDFNRKLLDETQMSTEGKDLIRALLIPEEKLRICVEDIINSAWVKKFELSEEQNVKQMMKFFETNNIVENFRKFEKYSNFKKEILFSIAKLCQDDEVRQLKKIFMEFDKDNSGSIDKDEVKGIFDKLGIQSSEAELVMIWSSLDFHRDGTVNYTEFLAASLSSSFFLTEEKLKFIFKFFDEKNNDYITPLVIVNVMKQNEIPIDQSDVLAIFEGNGEKKIDFEMFTKIMNEDKKGLSSKSTFYN